MRYWLGVDVGGTKTHALVAGEDGRACGLGVAGPGNHEDVGYAGLAAALQAASCAALDQAGISIDQIAGAGFGVGGYDWPNERQDTLDAIASLGLNCPVEAVNDAIIGLLAGSPEGWGIAIVAGTGCNCWGWDAAHARVGRVTGMGWWMAEAAGASEVVAEAVRAVSRAWSMRGPDTCLTQMLVEFARARDTTDLLEGITLERYRFQAEAAPLVFQAAAQGDVVAREIVEWAGRELGSLACGVIRQLGFETQEFDAVLVGSLHDGGPLLADTLCRTVYATAPGARFLRLAAPPAVGGVFLGMEQAGLDWRPIREPLVETARLLEKSRVLA